MEQGHVSATYLTTSVCRTICGNRSSQFQKRHHKKSRNCSFWSLQCSIMVNPSPSQTQQNVSLAFLVHCYRIQWCSRVFEHRNKIRNKNEWLSENSTNTSSIWKISTGLEHVYTNTILILGSVKYRNEGCFNTFKGVIDSFEGYNNNRDTEL